MSDPKDSERRAAEELARALTEEAQEGRVEAFDDPEVVELLRVAERVRASAGLVEPLHPDRRAEMVDAALRAARPRRRLNLYLAGGLLAAAIVLVVLGFIVRSAQPPHDADGSELVTSALVGPTDSLFDGPFPEDQSAAERMDRIVSARTRGYFSALILARSSPAVASAAVGGGTTSRARGWR